MNLIDFAVANLTKVDIKLRNAMANNSEDAKKLREELRCWNEIINVLRKAEETKNDC